MTSRVNPDDPNARDYSWAATPFYTLRAGRLPDAKEVCYLENAAEMFTPDEAIKLASDLLGWAMFVQEPIDEIEEKTDDRGLPQPV